MLNRCSLQLHIHPTLHDTFFYLLFYILFYILFYLIINRYTYIYYVRAIYIYIIAKRKKRERDYKVYRANISFVDFEDFGGDTPSDNISCL